uniref:Uncharacterized protein n=1 Tax=Oryza meridionalis TaxID=40149 RepID=A0A0E0DW81_9ORYZ
MERIIAMSVVGAGPGNVFGPGMSAGALESFVPRRQAGATDKAAAGEGTWRGATRPAEQAAAAATAMAAEGRRAGGDGGARFDPARDGLLYCFETISPH